MLFRSQAQAYANIVTGVYSYPGRYIDESGQLSSSMYLEDRDYYQKFSYVVRLSESLERYRKSMNDLIHPAGTKLYGQYSLVDESGAFRYESGAVNTFSQAGVNTTDIIITFDPADYLESVMNDGNSSIWYDSSNTTIYANIANAPYYIHGGISSTNDPANVVYDYSSSNMAAIRSASGPYYYGGAMLFDGNNDKISVDHNDTLNVQNSLTVVTWFSMINARQTNARTLIQDRKSTRLNSSHSQQSRMPSSA